MLFVTTASVWVLWHRRATPQPPEAVSGYIDPWLCSQCHGDVAATFYSSGMGRTLFRPAAKDVIEDYAHKNTVDHQASGLRYTMSQRDGHSFQSREQIGFDGATTNIAERQVDYVLGSGNHARTYLSQTSQGTLLQLPVSWYSDGAGYWAMTTGFDRPDQPDFNQPINSECLSCHSGSPLVLRRTGFADGTETLFRNNLPQGVDCQRCHGPGLAHYVAASTPGTSSARIRATILNPMQLDRDRQMDVCMQCHLQTGGRNVPSDLRRFDRDVFSYKPGEPLAAYKLYFVQPENVADDDDPANPDVVSAAYRLRKSACYRKSSMTCTTCHDPHADYRGPQSEERYVAVCLGCHSSVVHTVKLPANRDCISCHMVKDRVAPHNNPNDPIHINLTDHWIQRAPKGPSTSTFAVPAKPSNPVELYYPVGTASVPESGLYLDLAQVIHGDELQLALNRLRADLTTLAPKSPLFYLELSKGYLRAGQMEEAAIWNEAVIRTSPHDVPALKQYANLLLATGQWKRAKETLQQALPSAPEDSTLLDSLGYASLQEHSLADAREHLNRSLELNPEDAEAYDLLGLAAWQSGDTTEAAQQFRRAIRCQPTLADPRIHLAKVLAANQAYPEAEYQLRLALRINPGSAEGYRALGLVLMATGSYDHATDTFQKAALLDPKDVQTHEDLGDLLAARKDLETAASQYQLAIALNPNHAETHYSLGAVRRAQGRTAVAEQEFETSLQIDPTLLEAELEWGRALLSKHKKAEARPHLEHAARSRDPRIANAANSALAQLAP